MTGWGAMGGGLNDGEWRISGNGISHGISLGENPATVAHRCLIFTPRRVVPAQAGTQASFYGVLTVTLL